MDPDPLGQPPFETLGNGLTVVNRGIIQDYQGEAMRARVRKVVERRDDLNAPNPACMGVKIGFIGPLEQAQDVQPLLTATGQFIGNPWRLPGIGDARDQVETRGIKIEQVDLASGLRRL